jgi:hypothetical protein
MLPRRTSPEGVGALRGGAATVKHVRRSKGPFGCLLVIFSATTGSLAANPVNGVGAPGAAVAFVWWQTGETRYSPGGAAGRVVVVAA